MSDWWCWARGRLLVPGLDAGLAGDQAVPQIEHGYAQDSRAARGAAGLHEGRVALADDEALDLVRHVLAAHVGEVVADRHPPADDLRVAGLVVAVHDVQLGVLGIQAEQRCGVALLDAAAQCLGVKRLAGPRDLAGAHLVPPDRRGTRTPGTTIPGHRQRTVKAQARAHGPLRNCRDLGIPTRMTAAMLEIRVIGHLTHQVNRLALGPHVAGGCNSERLNCRVSLVRDLEAWMR